MDLPSGDKGGHRFRNSRDFGTVFDSSGASKDLFTIPESMQMSSDELLFEWLRFNERKLSSDAVSTVSREEVERFCGEEKKGAIGKTAKPSKPASGLPEAGSPTSAWFAYWFSMNPDMYALIKRIIVDRTLKIKDLKGQHNSTSMSNLYKGLRRANLYDIFVGRNHRQTQLAEYQEEPGEAKKRTGSQASYRAQDEGLQVNLLSSSYGGRYGRGRLHERSRQSTSFPPQLAHGALGFDGSPTAVKPTTARPIPTKFLVHGVRVASRPSRLFSGARKTEPEVKDASLRPRFSDALANRKSCSLQEESLFTGHIRRTITVIDQ